MRLLHLSSSSIKSFFKQSSALVGLVRDLKRLVTLLQIKLFRASKIYRYLKSSSPRKLQIGSGPTALPGWLCTDIAPRSPQIIYLDATERFPFENETFDFIYCEHMIEHISWVHGLFMLSECRRVLTKNGVIRVATPDLKVLIDLYCGQDTRAGDAYVKWVSDNFLLGVDVYKASFVINNAFGNWGHKFIYDGDLMRQAMSAAGFTVIKQCSYGVSEHPHLTGVETHGKNVSDSAMAIFETMIFEAHCLQ